MNFKQPQISNNWSQYSKITMFAHEHRLTSWGAVGNDWPHTLEVETASDTGLENNIIAINNWIQQTCSTWKCNNTIQIVDPSLITTCTVVSWYNLGHDFVETPG